MPGFTREIPVLVGFRVLVIQKRLPGVDAGIQVYSGRRWRWRGDLLPFDPDAWGFFMKRSEHLTRHGRPDISQRAVGLMGVGYQNAVVACLDDFALWRTWGL